MSDNLARISLRYRPGSDVLSGQVDLRPLDDARTVVEDRRDVPLDEQAVGQFAATHMRHNDVGEQDIHGPCVLFPDCNRSRRHPPPAHDSRGA